MNSKFREERHEGSQEGRASTRAFLPDAALGHVHVDVSVVEDLILGVLCDAEIVCVRLHPAKGYLRALSDDFAELSSQLEAALPGHALQTQASETKVGGQQGETYRSLDRHDCAGPVAQVAQTGANPEWRSVQVHPVLVVHRRAHVVL